MANMKEIITKAGTTAAFAVAMTAALAIPANASENGETPVTDPIVENPPVQEEAAPVETPVTEQEVVQHNEAVEERNEEVVQENEAVVESNESTASENASIVETNEETVESNETTAGENETIVQENETILNEENKETVEDNQQIADTNEDLIKDKELENELPDAPQLPETEVEDNIENPDAGQLPESGDIPGAPDTSELPEGSDLDAEDSEGYNENVDEANKEIGDINKETENANEQIGNANENIGDYNDQVGDTNEGIGNYNEQVGNANGNIGSYNEQVGAYNEAVGKINKELEDQFNKEHDEWEGKKNDHDIAVNNDKQNYDAKVSAYAAYETAIADMQAAYDALGEDPTEEELAAYEAAIAAAKDAYAKDHAAVTEYADGLNAYAANLEEKLAYAQNKQEYDEKVEQEGTRQEIYEEVLDYNEDIKNGNAAIEEANKALEDGLHADVVGSLAEAEKAKLNAAVDAELAKTPEGQAILETLSEKNRKALEGETTTLAETAAALEEEGNKGYDLGSAEYADYLERVKRHNDAVEALNNKLAAYNAAVAEYNKHVDDYNADKPENPTTSTEGGTQQEEGHVTDWGNINIDDYTLGHADVKYQAAASKDKKVDEEGKETYTETVTQYTVTGVYTSKTSYENGGSYGLTFDNDGDGAQKSDTQVLYVNGAYSEFSHMKEDDFWNHREIANIDPDSGTVSFYVTLKDAKGVTHGIDVSLDGNSVYAEGSYYKAQANDYLSKFRYMDENGNPIKDEDGNEIGLPTTIIGGEEYYNISGQSVFLISVLTCDGMQEDGTYTGHGWNQKFTPNGWLNPDGLDLILNLQTMIDIHKADNAKKITYQGYQLGMLAAAEAPNSDPGSEPSKPGDIALLEGPGEYTGGNYDDFTDPEPTLVQLTKLEELKELGTLTELETITELGDFETLKELEHKLIYNVPEEIPEEEPVWFNDDFPVEEVVEIDVEEEEEVAGGFLNILDEAVPLADAPNTGDASLIFGMSSLFSLTGLYLTGKKRRNAK